VARLTGFDLHPTTPPPLEHHWYMLLLYTQLLLFPTKEGPKAQVAQPTGNERGLNS
jgi:hypothetical protein